MGVIRMNECDHCQTQHKNAEDGMEFDLWWPDPDDENAEGFEQCVWLCSSCVEALKKFLNFKEEVDD